MSPRLTFTNLSDSMSTPCVAGHGAALCMIGAEFETRRKVLRTRAQLRAGSADSRPRRHGQLRICPCVNGIVSATMDELTGPRRLVQPRFRSLCLRARFITYGINTDLVNLGDAASKCPSVSGLRGSSRRAAMPRMRIGDVCADHPLGASARAAHPLAHRAFVIARGHLPRVDRRREAALENPPAAQRRRGGCRSARSAGLVHAEPVAAPPVVAGFAQARGWSTGVRAGVPLALAALLIGLGITLSRSARRRRH